MKLLTILLKNFRLLFRSKSSAFAVVIGPLLIIALIMMAFSGTEDYTISIGIIGASEEGTSADFVEQLETDEYNVITYYSLAQCIDDVKLSSINLCLNFPENFESDEPTVIIEEVTPTNGTNETNSTVITTTSKTKQVEFYVDQSRINIVESIIFALSTNIDATSEDLTLSNTLNVLNSMNNSAEEILDKQGSSSTAITNTVKPGIETITDNSEDISSENVNSETIDADQISDADTDATTVETSYTSLYTKVDDLMDAIDDCSAQPFADECEDLEDILSTKNTEITTSINSLQSALSSLETDIQNANNNLEASDEALERIKSASQEVEDEISAINTEINNIDNNLAVIQEEAENIQSLSAQDIENPFEITVNEIVSSSNRSQFMFPYYLMVLILFIGMMLSSNLIVMEKESLAFFRNFSTPTSEISHLVARFITNFIVLAVQVGVVLTAVYFLLDIPVMANYSVTLTILAISIALFILFGYLLGYLFGTQEGITIAFITVGGLFAFFSNLILPVESFPELARELLMFNPYMLASELLKKSILFNTGFVGLGNQLLLLVWYLIAAIILVVILQKISFAWFSIDLTKRGVLKRPHITPDKQFRLNDGMILKDTIALEHAINTMSDKEFEGYIQPNNEFSIWIKEGFGDKVLAKKVKKVTTRKEIVKVLKDHRKNPETRNWLHRHMFK